MEEAEEQEERRLLGVKEGLPDWEAQELGVALAHTVVLRVRGAVGVLVRQRVGVLLLLLLRVTLPLLLRDTLTLALGVREVPEEMPVVEALSVRELPVAEGVVE